MTTTVRLPHRVEQALATYCVDTKRTKSDVIVSLLEQHLLSTDTERAPYETASAAGFIGCVEGTADMSVNVAANAKKLVHQKSHANHPRSPQPAGLARHPP